MLAPKQEEALLAIQNGHNAYIGGPAGCGKSFLIQKVMDWGQTVGKSVALTCSTGIACSNFPSKYKAMTVHKWSGIRDGRYPGSVVRRLLLTDDNYLDARSRILGTDILIVDEISMLSKRLFEILEESLHIKDPTKPFGGIQVVLFGDFLQLPPIKNIKYGDLGEFCFTSLQFPSHHIHLNKIFRQNEETLINLIHVLSHGRINPENQDIRELLLSLQRPLTDENDVTHLYAKNMLADIYNRDCISHLPGDLYTFNSTDTGEARDLQDLVVPKILWLKVGAKVVLLRNLSDVLVNGLQGKVESISQDVIKVFFPTIDSTVDIRRSTFTVFDPATNKNTAERYQFPLKPAYGLTMHKAQGMTLDRVIVDCREIFQPGQLAVAVGRCRSLAGLKIINFSEDAVIPQPTMVTDFLKKETVPFEEDLSCCKTVRRPLEDQHDDIELVAPADMDLPDLDEDDFSDDGFDQDMAQLPDTFFTESNIPQHDLPTNFDTLEELRKLIYPNPLNEKQKNINSIIQCFIENKDHVTAFVKNLFSIFMEMYKKSVTPKSDRKVAQPQLNNFFQQWHVYMTSTEFKSQTLLLKSLLEEMSGYEEAVHSVLFKLGTLSRQLVVSVKASDLPVTGPKFLHERTSSQLKDSAAARGKVRYIGGYVVATLRHKYTLQVKSLLYKTGEVASRKYEFSLKMIELLDSMKVSEHFLSQTTSDPESLLQIARKQNLNRGLTNISDSAYIFFEHLVCEVISELTVENFNTCDNLSEYLSKTLIQKKPLLEELSSLISADQDLINSLFEEILGKVCAVLLKQFTKDIISSLQIEKKMEHRKQINVSGKKRKSVSSEPQPSTSGTKSVKKSSSSKSVTKSKESGGKGSTAHEFQSASSDSGSEEEENFCFRCGEEYKEDEDWIACDDCNHWFHRQCCGLSSVKSWNYYKSRYRKFHCQDCKKKK